MENAFKKRNEAVEEQGVKINKETKRQIEEHGVTSEKQVERKFKEEAGINWKYNSKYFRIVN